MPPRLCIRPLSTPYSLPFVDSAARCTVIPLRKTAPFSTSTPLSKNSAVQKKSGSQTGPPKKGGRTLKLSKNVRAKDTRPPAPGERKAIRKRIILSNTNALEAPGLQRLSKSNCSDENIKSKVMALPDEVVDSLRAVEAFKVGQGWGFFRKPATLIRGEAFKLGKSMDDMAKSNAGQGEIFRRVIHGDRATGKSVLLLQAMAMAFLKGWIVISIPEARDVTIGHTEYTPLPNSKPTEYVQRVYVANLLQQMAKANRAVLREMRPIHKHQLPIPVQSNISLDRFAELGAQDPEIAWPIFQALWKELTSLSQEGDPEPIQDALSDLEATQKRASKTKSPATNPFRRPPILMAIDNVSHLMTNSHYNTVDENGKLHPIHAHDLSIVKHFMSYLSGTRTLANGGMVLAATSGSDHAKSDALDVGIAMAHARQETPPQPGQTQNVNDFWDPYRKMDQRSLELLKAVGVIKMEGLSREEARTVMEYWAGSGLLRDRVGERLVGEKWTLSGGGIVGELEKAVVRQRV